MNVDRGMYTCSPIPVLTDIGRRDLLDTIPHCGYLHMLLRLGLFLLIPSGRYRLDRHGWVISGRQGVRSGIAARAAIMAGPATCFV